MGIFPTSLFYNKNLDSQRCNVVVNSFIHLYSSNKFRYKQVQRTTNWFGMVFTVVHVTCIPFIICKKKHIFIIIYVSDSYEMMGKYQMHITMQTFSV
jgi:hypothetical protein